jgi:hypothetical protein
MTRSRALALTLGCSFFAALIGGTQLSSQTKALGQKATDSRMAPRTGTGDIAGAVTSARGPEAGVWVIAETADVGTNFRKIVVTDDQGRYLIPELPKAIYKVWVRGYGLVDSTPVQASPGDTLALLAVVAPSAREAAQYYPSDYWYSLVQIPPKAEFPLAVAAPSKPASDRPSVLRIPTFEKTIQAQAQWVWQMKGVCERCHQMGDKSTREIPSSIGTFSSSTEAWERFLRSGQVADEHTTLNFFGHDRALAMFADWTDRIAKGELPPEPPRPQGIERNVVLSIWDYSVTTGFPHDITTTVRNKPTTNAYGPVYSPDWSADSLAALDPSTNEKYMIRVPLRDESIRKMFPTWSAQSVEYPSPYWGSEVVRTDTLNPGPSMMDSKGRVWFTVQTRLDVPSFCKEGSSNSFAKNFAITDIKSPAQIRSQIAGVDYYDPKTGKFGIIDLCYGGGHTAFGYDKDETLYITPRRVNGLGWVKTRVWDETHDPEKSQGWCPAVIDYNGDGKTGAFTRPPDPPDPKLDRYIGGGTGYIIAVNPVDGSVWYSILYAPGRIIRMVTGDNPPETCKTEVYEAPFDFKDVSKQDYFSPEGIDIDSNGIVWVALAGSGHLARFDRSKCKVMNGPTATGQQCPEGWTMFEIPGPKFRGTNALADFSYNSWVDRYDTFGLGKNVSVISGSGSDSLIAFVPETKKWVRLRVPYPMGLFTRSLEGRIDDPKAGWKGRGLWVANETREPWQSEGGRFSKDRTPFVVHLQIRPDPLAK